MAGYSEIWRGYAEPFTAPPYLPQLTGGHTPHTPHTPHTTEPANRPATISRPLKSSWTGCAAAARPRA
eukprot:43508-Prymnesium_polylepis.1